MDQEEQNDPFEDFQKADIPEKFKSTIDGKPFSECLVCNCNLLDGDVDYVIEKSFKKYDGYDFESTVFEFAICMKCANEMRDSMSDESKENLERYFMQNAKMEDRFMAFNAGKDYDWEQGLSNCVINGTSSSQESEYQICAQCRGDQMIIFQMPFMIGSAAMDEMSELLSDDTIDELDDFMGKYGVPPELRELFTDKPVLVF